MVFGQIYVPFVIQSYITTFQISNINRIGQFVVTWSFTKVVFGLDSEWFWIQNESGSHPLIFNVLFVKTGSCYSGGQFTSKSPFSGVGLQSRLYYLVSDDKRIGYSSNHVQIPVGLGFIGRLTVISSEGKHAIISRPFISIFYKHGETLPDFGWSPVKKRPQIPFVDNGAIQAVITIQGQTILAGLQVFESIRYFALSKSDPVFFFLVERNVGISIPDLGKMIDS